MDALLGCRGVGGGGVHLAAGRVPWEVSHEGICILGIGVYRLR